MARPSAPPETDATINGKFALLADGPTGDWLYDVNRPPLGSLVAMLFRALVDRLDVHMAEHGVEPVRPSYLYVLRTLHPKGVSVTALAESCEVTKQAISQTLAGMERMRLVRRTPDPQDGRGKIVSLTKRGQAVLEAAVLSWGEVELEWDELLDRGGIQEMREAMFAFIENYGDWHRGEQPRLRPVW
jgi:DNA-binding MarR family transcriptional regulator